MTPACFVATPNAARRLFQLLIAVVVMASALTAAPLERDLGEGLVYFRVHELPADLPSDAALQNRTCVLDLRYVVADTATAEVLGGWLKFHGRAKTPLLVLVNGTTSTTIHAELAGRRQMPGLLTIGIAGQKFEPDIAVVESAPDEQQAYKALESGTTIASLTTDHPEKQRNDEASLSHERPAASGDNPANDKAGAKNATAMLDAPLQRAIHLHRALKAMKKV